MNQTGVRCPVSGVQGGVPLAALLLAVTGSGVGAQSRFRPEERVVISDFSRVQAVAASRDRVYGVTTEGLIIYDRRFDRWEAPVTRVDGYPDLPARAAVVDPADESLWVASDAGLVHYQPLLRQLDVMSVGAVIDLAFDRDNPVTGIYFRTRGGDWEMIPRGGLMGMPALDVPPVMRRVQPAALETVLHRFPAAQAMAPTTLVSPGFQRFDFTSAAIPPGENDAYFGTNGLGLYHFDALSARLEPMHYGLRSMSVGAVSLIPGGGWVRGGAWVATNADVDAPAGIARVSEDIQEVTYENPQGAAVPAFREVRDLIAHPPELWAATEQGVMRFTPGDNSRLMTADSPGLPASDVLALAESPAGVWIGTSRGLALSPPAAAPVTVGAGRFPVLSLVVSRDTVWVGTARGLRIGVAGLADLFIPDDVAAEPALAQPVTALARHIDTLVAATPDRIAWRRPGGGWTVERPLSEIGELRALATDRAGVWIGGSRGLGFFRFTGRSFVTFPGPDYLPGGVTSIVVAGPYLWIGTERGLVRFQRRALVP